MFIELEYFTKAISSGLLAYKIIFLFFLSVILLGLAI
jgi:hypothetical protein